MADCSNVEIREMLPERASGALSAADLARVDGHLTTCATCGDELALIQSARLVLRRDPRLDVARISAAVRAATSAPARPMLVADSVRPRRAIARARWIGWKTAAAVALAAAGGGTMLVARSVSHDGGAVAIAPVVASAPAAGTTATTPAATATAGEPTATPALNVSGELSDLSQSDLRSLLDDIGSLGVDAPSFEEPGAVIPGLADAGGATS